MVEPNLSRREFTLLSAATAGALLAGDPGRAVESEHLTDRYAFLLGHVEAEFPIPTLARFTDESGFDALAELDVEYRTHADGPTAHAALTPAQAETVAEAEATDLLEYAPGSNPFWKLGAYDGGVFPDPGDSVDYIAYEEALAGLSHLESAHPDRLRVETIGSGHGHENVFEGEADPRDVWLVELTDDVGEAYDRETVVFGLSVHGDERAGVEAGLRFIEDVLTGERPEVAGMLSECRLVFVGPNPDGWVVRQQVYEDPVDPPDFRRYNGADRDLNRQQPVAGWIPPRHLPGEPRGANLVDDAPGGVDGDVPEQATDEVPETLALVERLRSYDVAYLVDLHGMYGHTNAILALEGGGGTPGERVDSDLLTRAVETRLQEAVGPLDDWTGAFEGAVADTAEQREDHDGCGLDLLCQLPVELFGHGTTLDTIDYTVSGGLTDWAGLPEAVGGLDATALTLEIVFSNSLPEGMERRFMPDVVAFHVAAYGAACAATVEHAADDVGVTVETGGRSTAYLESEELVRRAADLPHVGDGAVASGGTTGGTVGSSVLAGGRSPGRGSVDGTAGVHSTLAVDSQQFAPGEPVTSTVEVPEATHTLSVEVRTAGDRIVEATLRDGDGNAVQHTEGPTGSDRPGSSTLTALDPGAGEWQVEASVRGGAASVEVQTTRLVADGTPDPMDTLGYGQRDYEARPLAALDALGSVADGPVEAVSVESLRSGALVADGVPVYDNLVVSHDHGVDGEALTGLAAYVEAGGNLVLTDSGLELVADLEVAGLAAVDGENVIREKLEAAEYPGLDASHPLAADRRTFHEESSIERREPWMHPPLGYARDEVPMYAIDGLALQDAGATVASAAGARVRLATVPTERDRIGVHLLGSLLPPASQENLHPFGLLDHSLTSLGYLLLCNALGYRLVRSRNGQQVSTVGSVVDIDYGGGDDDGDDEDGTGGDGDDDGDDEGGTDGDGDDDGQGNDDAADDSSDDDGDAADGSDTADDGAASADDGGPGFGVAAGVAGLGGLGYLLSRRVADTEFEGE